MSKIKHAVVLINYKNAKETLNCIRSINNSKDKPHIIVVDNGSSKECVQELKAGAPGLDLIVGDNVGFSAGNNKGIRKALKMGAEVVYILNNDTEVDPNVFKLGYRYVAGKDRIAGAKIYYAKGYEYYKKQQGRGDVIWYGGGYMDWSMAVANHTGIDQIDKGQCDHEVDVDFITGCFIAVPRQVFDKIGLLDEPYFLYLEDADFCLKANQAKIEVKYNPQLVVYHRNSSSTGVGSPLVDYYMTRNRYLISKRYGGPRMYFALLREGLRNFNNPIRRQALIDHLLGRMGNRNAQIQKVTQKS